MTALSGVVGRSVALLRAIADDAGDGVTTSHLAQRIGVPRPTVHRLLESLEAEGMVDRDRRTGRWYLGPEMYVLGAASAPRYDIVEKAAAGVRRLASETGESAFFSLRRGDHTVVLMREDGDFPIRSYVLYEGARFPLGVVSAGLVVLAYLSDKDIDTYLRRADLTKTYGRAHRTSEIKQRIARTREDGYAVNPGLIVEGSWGMAAAVFDSHHAPIGALTLTGIESRFSADRQPRLGRLLLQEANRLSRLVNR